MRCPFTYQTFNMENLTITQLIEEDIRRIIQEELERFFKSKNLIVDKSEEDAIGEEI